MRNVEILKYAGKDICYLDFSGLKEEQDIFELIVDGKMYMCKKSSKSIFCLINMQGMHFNNQIKGMLADFFKGNKSYVKANAIIGASGFRQILFLSTLKLPIGHFKWFTSAELAKIWLVSQA
jgi:hypothetical protein